MLNHFLKYLCNILKLKINSLPLNTFSCYLKSFHTTFLNAIFAQPKNLI